MIKTLDVKNTDITNDILHLQKVSYQVEAEIIGFDHIPPLMDTISSIRECDETFLGYYSENNVLAGIISYKVEGQVLDIHRLAVHPDFFRKGIAKKLLTHVQSLNYEFSKIIVSTGLKNKPAINLYLKFGFERIRTVKVEEGIDIVLFEKPV